MASDKRTRAKERERSPEQLLSAAAAAFRELAPGSTFDPESRALGAALKAADQLISILSSKELLPSLQALQSRAREAVDAIIDALPTRLSRVLEDTPVEVQGVRPDFILDGGLHIHLDEESLELVVGTGRVPLTPWRKTAQTVGRELGQLRALEFNPDDFTKMLFIAYEQAAATIGKRVGTVVPIERVLQALAVGQQPRSWRLDPVARNYRSYGRDQLRMQLCRLLRSRPRTLWQGYRLSLTAGSSTENALFMFVPPLGRCAYVGLVSWTPDDGGDATHV